MNEELLTLAIKKIEELNKKLEKYYDILRIENELDFILNGTYIFEEEIDDVVSGNY